MNGGQIKNSDSSIVKEKHDITHIETTIIDKDAERLRDLGYKQEFQRNLGAIMQIGFPFTIMSVLPNYLVGFGPSLYAGGPSSLFWSWVVITPFVLSVSLSMAEMYSAYPLNGGIYSWCYFLSGKKWGPFMSWLSGYVYLFAGIVGNIVVAWNLAQLIVGIVNVIYEQDVSSTGMYVGIYYAVILTGTGSSLFGVKFINYLNYFMIFWLFAGTIVFAIGIPCLAPSHQSAKWVFTEFQNYTGYENKGIVFFLGLLQAGWTMVGYDSGVTLSENTKDAARKGPQGIILCVSLALLQGFALTICILFSIQDFDALLNAESPVSEFLLQVTRSKPATIFFLVYMVISQYGSLANSGVSTSRVIWAMSRDGCLPFSNVLYKLHKDTPIRAVLLLMLIMVLTILPVFGTFIYWQAILSTSIIGNNVAYGLPYFCRLVWSRHDMPKGPFDLGKWSIPLNAIAVLWLCFFTVILCLPTTLPVNGEVMNYSSLMIGVLFIFSISFWFYKGRRTYNGPVMNVD